MFISKPNLQKINIQSLGVCVLFVMLAGCGSDLLNLELGLKATNHVNPSEGGQPVPVVVRIYTLRDKDRFEKATFQELWKQDHEFLGDDLLDRKELTLKPKSQEVFQITADPEKDENYLGIMALFRKYQTGTWRTVIPIEEPGFFSIGDPEVYLQADHYNLQEVEPD